MIYLILELIEKFMVVLRLLSESIAISGKAYQIGARLAEMPKRAPRFYAFQPRFQMYFIYGADGCGIQSSWKPP